LSSQADQIVRALRKLTGRDPEEPLRLDGEAVLRAAETRLRAAGRLAAAPFVELLGVRPAPAAETRSTASGTALGLLARHRRPVSLAACLLIVALAAVSTLPAVSAAQSQPLPEPSADASVAVEYAGPAFYQPDGTIYNTIQIGDSAAGGGAFQWYTVVSGDTVRKIAGRFNISANTLYWANKSRLPYPESIQIGLRLLIPPVDGVVIVPTAGDTLDSLAKKYKVSTQAIAIANVLPDDTVTAGEMLVIPVEPNPMPTPKPGCVGSCSYSGGTLRVPIAGYFYISQYFSSRHPAIDLAAATGTPVVAAAGGKVIYAGWKNSGAGAGGGIVVWINHNGKLYTTYNHLSAEFVKVGQTVAAGQRIGSVGETGNATGPHLHFEVWVCYPWTGGTTGCARNPLNYLP
jgi:murein DD-endopeptidase MepM/ murein hydrolase activator NlpD